MKLYPCYRSIKQRPYCCVPACIQMILERRGISYAGETQEEIGTALGLVVPRAYGRKHPSIATGTMPPYGWGTRIHLMKYGLNEFFSSRKIPLMSIYHTENTSIQKISSAIKEDKDILVCYRVDLLDDRCIHAGHASLIEEISNSKIVLVDPAEGKRKRLELENLIRAVDEHSIGEQQYGGFWIISEKNSLEKN